MLPSPPDPQHDIDWHAHWQAEAERHAQKRGWLGWLAGGHMPALALGVVVLMGLMWGAINWRRLAHAGPPSDLPVPAALSHASQADTLSAHFARCHGGQRQRITCVIDGDTIWYNHEKYRIADINAPEVSEPQCNYELDLGEKATDRLIQLLNAGPFSLVATETRDADKYGRKLRTIMRGGHSLGMQLVNEGLAEKWVGYRRNWCQ